MRTAIRPILRALALASMLTSPLCPAAGASAPPDYPDALPLPEGCFISTLAYLATFAAEFPAEQRVPFTTFMKASQCHHTAALMTWRGEWWLRDEHLGVIRLGVTAAGRGLTERVTRAADAVLLREASRLSQARRRHILSAGHDLDKAQAVERAARLLPVPGEIYLVESGGREFRVLFFRPAPGQVAVYDPRYGTATAESTSTQAAAIVEAVARRLGYRVSAVRLDLSRLVASAGRGP